MKKIVVLTDFSEETTSSAFYALGLAQAIKANILLFNSFLVPSSHLMSNHIAWPMEDAAEVKQNTEAKLGALADRLREQLLLKHEAPSGLSIDFRCTEGVEKLNLIELMADRDVVLFVIATHHQGLHNLFLTNHVQEILNEIALPVLIVPARYEFKEIKKISFATDMDEGSIEVLNCLTSLARPFNAEIMLAHLSKHSWDELDQVNSFLQDVRNNINYPNIYYRNIRTHHISEGFRELEENEDADLLTIIHHAKSAMGEFFHESYTMGIERHLKIPLLVFPYRAEFLPVF